MNMSCGSNVDGTVHVTLEASGDSVIEAFRKDVFDSPLLRFKLADKVGIILKKRKSKSMKSKPTSSLMLTMRLDHSFPEERLQ